MKRQTDYKIREKLLVTIKGNLEKIMETNLSVLCAGADILRQEVLTNPYSKMGTLKITLSIPKSLNCDGLINKIYMDSGFSSINMMFIKLRYDEEGFISGYYGTDTAGIYLKPFVICVNPKFKQLHKLYNEQFMYPNEIEDMLRVIYNDFKTDKHDLMQKALKEDILYCRKIRQL